MANLSIRKLNDETIARLRARAARNQVSMEEEARRIIRQAVTPPQRLGDLAVQYFGARSGVELELPAHAPHDALSFS
ncbi:MAG: FitA-like ribbon-helix-helix domain-containing protein [Rhodoferax sp.]